MFFRPGDARFPFCFLRWPSICTHRLCSSRNRLPFRECSSKYCRVTLKPCRRSSSSTFHEVFQVRSDFSLRSPPLAAMLFSIAPVYPSPAQSLMSTPLVYLRTQCSERYSYRFALPRLFGNPPLPPGAHLLLSNFFYADSPDRFQAQFVNHF